MLIPARPTAATTLNEIQHTIVKAIADRAPPTFTP
jgi:hypothetical protein